MLDVPRASGQQGLRWWAMGRFVFMSCRFGHTAMLDHVISDLGVVTPSVVCPAEGCTFHEFVRLLNWP